MRTFRLLWCWILPRWMFRIFLVYVSDPLDSWILYTLFPRHKHGLVSHFLVRLYKLIMRFITGYGELFRIAYVYSDLGIDDRDIKTKYWMSRFDPALYYSNQYRTIKLRQDEDFAKQSQRFLLQKEQISHPSFEHEIKVYNTLSRIILPMYNFLDKNSREAMNLSKTCLDNNNKVHQKKISILWESYYCDMKQDFTILGFQQKEQPFTDFRGTGLLGLELLVYYGQSHPEWSHIQVKESHNHIPYPFALVALHIIQTMIQKLRQHDPIAMYQFYHCCIKCTKKEELPLYEWFSYAMFAFHLDWKEQSIINDIMDFTFRYYEPYWVPQKLMRLYH